MRSKSAELQFVEPLRPTLADSPPAGDGWIHEVKFDGYRTQIVIDRGRIRLFTMDGYDWTEKYWPVALGAEALPCWSAIIDGEVIVTNDQGASDFAALQAALGKEPGKLSFVAFDLLHIDGRDLLGKPLIERKAALAALLAGTPPKIQFSQHFETDGDEFFNACDAMGLEGIISKRPGSRYRSGPSKDWLKIKCFAEADFEVLGVVRKPGEAPLSLMADRDRNYVGSAFVQLDRATRERFWNRVETMKAKKAPAGVRKPGAEWVKPGMIGRVKFLKGDGIRHASLRNVLEAQG